MARLSALRRPVLDLLALASTALVAAPGLSQPVPVGTEVLVNAYTTGAQSNPQVGMADGGGFVVAWVSLGQDGDQDGLFARRFQSDGTPFAELPLNTFTTSNQLSLDLDMNGSGDWVAGWQSFHQLDASSPFDVMGRASTTNGTVLLAEAPLAPVVTENSTSPAVSRAADDTFVVVWNGGTGSAPILGRRFTAGGSPVTLGALALGDGALPAVATLPGSDFVIAYQAPDEDQDGIFVARYSAAGALLVGPLRANSDPVGNQGAAQIAATATGEYLVAWKDDGADTVEARRFGATGAPIGSEIVLSNPADGHAGGVDLDASGRGAFVVAWTQTPISGGSVDVRAREVFRTGSPLGPSFIANPTTAGSQSDGQIAAGNSVFVVVWTAQDGDNSGVAGQRYQRQALFAEDYETADTSAWSATSP
jgi:hypothetical protein